MDNTPQHQTHYIFAHKTLHLRIVFNYLLSFIPLSLTLFLKCISTQHVSFILYTLENFNFERMPIYV